MNSWPTWWKSDPVLPECILPIPLCSIEFPRYLPTALHQLDTDLK